ncbi:MAG: LysM peptidoglycan-binding domain-containing protein [Deltaproteobacteria bacterium]|nr:LysM peptidoglycan-binding domain-containing protein [Deltaproteobacteria bacterium]
MYHQVFGGKDSDGDVATADTAATETPPAAVEMISDAVTTPPPAEEPAPAPVTASAPAAPSTGEFATYDVKKGDTLMKIAFELYGDVLKWKSLYETNKDALKNANVLQASMKLKYEKPASEPAIAKVGDPYKIKKGDTLGTIADDVYGKKSKWKLLWENNRALITDPNRIYAGFYLYYQITEQEKKEAEEIKAKRGAQPQQLGSAVNQAPAAAPAPETAPADVVTSATAAVPSDGEGLQGLAAPQAGDRMPASAPKSK